MTYTQNISTAKFAGQISPLTRAGSYLSVFSSIANCSVDPAVAKTDSERVRRFFDHSATKFGWRDNQSKRANKNFSGIFI